MAAASICGWRALAVSLALVLIAANTYLSDMLSESWDSYPNRLRTASIAQCLHDHTRFLRPARRELVGGGHLDKVYVIHYSRAAYRRDLMAKELARVGINVSNSTAYEFVTLYDREELGSEQALRSCTRCGEHHGMAVCSVNLKHVAAWMDIVRMGYETALILEDDIDLSGVYSKGRFNEDVAAIMADLDGRPFDTIILGKCVFARFKEKHAKPVSPRLVMPRPRDGHSRCMGAYLVSNRGARRLLMGLPYDAEHPYPDHHLNKVGRLFGRDFVGLWAHPPVAHEMRLPGSQRHIWRQPRASSGGGDPAGSTAPVH